MKAEIKNDSPAFPLPFPTNDRRGLTKLEYFAGQAMIAFIQRGELDNMNQVADKSILMARAIIRDLNKYETETDS